MQNIKQVLNESGRTISNKDRGLASMMDNEPRMQDRRPEGQMFAIESEIKNMMKEYEMAVRNGENQRAQMIADQVGKLEEMKIEIQETTRPRQIDNIKSILNAGTLGMTPGKDMGGRPVNMDADTVRKNQMEMGGLGRFGMAGGGDVVGISPEDKQMIQRAFSTQSGFDVGQTAQMLKNILVKKYPNIPENQINAILSKGVEDYSARPPIPRKMAEGGEAQMQMSEQEAMAELEAAKPDFEIIEKLVMAVVQMISQGMDEAEVREYLREQGLDNEDMEELFQMVAERLQEESQAPAEEPIGKQLQGIM